MNSTNESQKTNKTNKTNETFDDDDEDDDEIPELIKLDENNNEDVKGTSEGLCENRNKKRLVPLTVLTGFLGSGKTTLIKNILENKENDKKIAIIENEFSSNGSIESLIIKNSLSKVTNILDDDIVELPNGCVCCSLRSSLVGTIDNLLERKPDLDYIILETSGMANPGPIATMLWFDQRSFTEESSEIDSSCEKSLQKVYLDGIVTLVDAKNFLFYFQETYEEVSQQLAYADRIILNKIDLIKDNNLIRKVIKHVNPTALVYETSYSKVENLFDIINLKSMECTPDSLFKYCMLAGDSKEVQLKKSLDHVHTKNSVSTIALYHHGSVSLSKMHSWLANILWPNQDDNHENLQWILENDSENETLLTASPSKKVPNEEMYIFRIKGILSVWLQNDAQQQHGDKETKLRIDCRKHIVQAVDDTWEIYAANSNLNFEEKEERLCQMIFIGRHLDKTSLNHGFRNCFLSQP